jgi:periplasmic divalent cation tolerance protein
MEETVVILSTAPDEETAKRLAQGLIHNRLAACVNIMPGIRSIYRWQDSVQEESEAMMVIKSTRELFTQLEPWLRENHPYDVPEILALPAAAGSSEYMHWVKVNVG